MALESIKNINVDFYDNRYILINAKQYDDNSRYIAVTCYNQGRIFNLSSSKHTAYVRYKKADGNHVFNFCTIDVQGRILIELTKQMLVASGMCDVDLVIVNKGNAVINVDTGEIIAVDNSEIISTIVFRIYVYEAAVDNSLIESSNEYTGLIDALEMANAEYTRVINASETWALNSQSWAIGGTGVEGRADVEDTDNAKYYSNLSKSYAIGDADDIRNGENTDNAKYYSELSSNSADAADESEAKALEYRNATNEYMVTTQGYMETTKTYMDTTNSYLGTTIEHMETTEEYMDATEEYMNTANEYMNTTQGYMNSAQEYMETAESYKNNAEISETNAATSESNAKTSEENANTYMTNANEYMRQTKEYKNTVLNIVDGLNSGFIPMGTITFAELATVEKATGFTYNISDDFVTDESFAEGVGKQYTAGTNVYCRADGLWDCFGGAASLTATVDEVKEYLEI